MDVRELASNVKERADDRLGSWASSAPLREADVVFEVGASEGTGSSDDQEVVTLSLAESAPSPAAVVGVLTSRTATTYWRLASSGIPPEADELMATPVPAVPPVFESQLEVLVRRRRLRSRRREQMKLFERERGVRDGAANWRRVAERRADSDESETRPRSEWHRLDWAIERVVVELYGLRVRELARLQREWQ